MSLAVAGMGWITPLGSGLDPVWQRLLQGQEACGETITDELGNQFYTAFRVPELLLTSLTPHPRLRRASAISRFAAVAGLQALKNAELDEKTAARIALVFAISNGGVIYTRRFYRDIVESGAQSASPLLFPETVFNAAASHFAAILGITGAVYTLVGDSAVGLLAIKMAEDIMANPAFDYCLVVGTEEVDWLLCDAYRRWRLLRTEPPVEPFRKPARGMILSEGAGALLLARKGSPRIERVSAGGYYRKRAEIEQILSQIVRDLMDGDIDFIVSSANGTFVDKAECDAFGALLRGARVYTPKPALGESVGAAGLWQVIVAALGLQRGELPPVLHAPKTTPLRISAVHLPLGRANDAIVLSCGVNHQAAGLRVSMQ